MVAITDILEAHALITPHIRRTPVMKVDPADFGLAWRGRITLKLECLQHTGSFKVRGALNTMLAQKGDDRPVAAISGGNHGAAVAYAAQKLGRKAVIFVPDYAPKQKVEKIRSYGPDLRITGSTISETIAAYEAFLASGDICSAHPYDAPLTIAGQGTLGLEWSDQAPDLDTVLVAIGGGGLISGVGASLAAGPSVIGIEPETANCAFEARAAGRPVEKIAQSFAKDSLGAASIGALNHEMISDYVDDLILVSDEDIRRAQAALWRVCSVAAEPGGACALAALLSGAVTPEPGAHIGVLVCGANFSPADLRG